MNRDALERARRYADLAELWARQADESALRLTSEASDPEGYDDLMEFARTCSAVAQSWAAASQAYACLIDTPSVTMRDHHDTPEG